MLRLVFATALIAACHPAPAPTVVHAPIAAAPTTHTAPVRQDFEMAGAIQPGPLHEVLATGHECRQPPPPPIDGEWLPATGGPLSITVTPVACDGHRDGQPVLH